MSLCDTRLPITVTILSKVVSALQQYIFCPYIHYSLLMDFYAAGKLLPTQMPPTLTDVTFFFSSF